LKSPDFKIDLGAVQVVCEVKQIDPNKADLAELHELQGGEPIGRFVPNRLRSVLKRISPQLKASSESGVPTMLVIYDNTPFKLYTQHSDVVQAMFGHNSVAVTVSSSPGSSPVVSSPFFGGNRGLTPRQNTAVSAIAVLDGGPTHPGALRVYHNPYAQVRLEPQLLVALEVDHRLLPDATRVSL
jgi:hypothetical protein